MKTILFVQYTNPAGYPPLEHSSRILADAGWRVLFLGTKSYTANELTFPPHPNVSVRLLRFQPPGWRQKLHYLWFVAWCVGMTATRRPTAVYCSDLFSTPVGLAVWFLLRIPVVYHEHDTPVASSNHFLRAVHVVRRRLAQVAKACVLPNHTRLERFVGSTSRDGPTFLVWNCPRRDEVGPGRSDLQTLRVFYVGVVGPTMLPETLVKALAEASNTQLVVAGYTVVGAENYPNLLRQLAEQIGAVNRVELHGPLNRAAFYRLAATCHVGVVTLPMRSDNINIEHLVGASNKAFDYMACGLAVLATDRPDWRSFIADAGLGRTCDSGNASEIGRQLLWFADHPIETRLMGERGRQRILAEWNYETQFAPVKRLLEGL